MELMDYISTDHITISLQETVAQTLAVFEEIPYSHIPVVVGQKLLGNIPKEDLKTIEDKELTIEEVAYLFEYFFAKEEDILLEVFSNFAVNNTSMLPIVNKDKQYIGYLDLNDTLDYFSDTDFLNTEGNILLLEKKTTEYTMSEICQIVESNNNMVLGCFISKREEEHTLITLKVKSININQLIQSFRRYDYYIINNLTEDSYLEGLKKRSEYFIKYLNI
ncbi:CBS domain-containing protein [Ochrovirga pacifica]|uniref:CBS domain-containing protein n=1 Tax=Ochrovirga pacifica TaxID=1042376 RepID=UPI00025591C1|nr:CBS domain-containing protein [Ochrovirga pacifica]